MSILATDKKLNFLRPARAALLLGCAVSSLVLFACAEDTQDPDSSSTYSDETSISVARDRSVASAYSYAPRAVDVLWVVDTSGGLSQAQKLVADRAPILLNDLANLGIDYQMAVTTMDTSDDGERGRFLAAGGASILTSHDANASAIMATRLFAGDYDWHPAPHALEAVKLALSEPNSVSGPNMGFARPDAMLVVIFVTASNDQSPLADYKSFLDTLKPATKLGQRGWMAEFMGVLPSGAGTGACRSASAQAGVAYQALVEASSGTSASLCGDVGAAVGAIRDRLVQMVTAYPLGAQKVEASQISVSIDGRVLMPDAANGWTFDSASNSILFHGTATPSMTNKVVVSLGSPSTDGH